MQLSLKRIGYFIGGLFLLNIFLSLLDKTNENSEYMKVIGDFKWTDNLASWQKRLPNCPMQNQPNELYSFPYTQTGFYEEEKKNKLVKELCSFKIGGINFALSSSDRYDFKQVGGEIYDRGTYFLKKLTLNLDKKDSIDLYDIFKNKYNCSRNKGMYKFICISEYSEYRFRESFNGQPYVMISPTSKSIAILRNKSEKIYRSEVGKNKLDPNDF